MKAKLELIGWLIFLFCSILFIISGIRSNDIWTTSASVLFGLGVSLFLVTTWPTGDSK